MVALISFLLNVVASLFKSKSRLEAENAALRHQLIVLQRKVRGRVPFTNSDRLFFVQPYRWFPSVLTAVTIIRPETFVRWHRAGFRRYWRWKSRSLGGRPQIDADLRALIRGMSIENALWGAPHIHGELLKLDFAVAQSTIAKYMTKRPDPSVQGWAPSCATTRRTSRPWTCSSFLPSALTCSMSWSSSAWRAESLSGSNVTPHPTAEWIAQQITEAFPWSETPRYLIRDQDRIYGAAIARRLRAMGIRDKPIAPGSPWQNAFAERLIGSIRRECVDHIVVCYARYYNEMRTNRSLDKDAPLSRPVQRTGSIMSRALLGGLHHHYVRV